MTIHLTAHAIERCIERVPHVSSQAEAELALRSAAVETAARIGAPFVRLGTGQRVVLVQHTVVTVLPKDHPLRRMGTARDADHGVNANSSSGGAG